MCRTEKPITDCWGSGQDWVACQLLVSISSAASEILHPSKCQHRISREKLASVHLPSGGLNGARLLQLKPEGSTSVTVVGDTHGQLHDVLNM